MSENESGPDKDPLIVVAGPTAVGKSRLAAEIARRIDGEVISADSMQVYRYMDIGSAKVTLEEMLGVPHHMIDVEDPRGEMDVSRYAAEALRCVRDILMRGHIPVLCGGTGFYIQAVTNCIDFNESSAPDEEYRAFLRKTAEERGNIYLHEMLRKADPDAAEDIHPNNLKRVIRALEFAHETGGRISEHNARERRRESPWNLCFFYLDDDREELYQRIDRRVDFMMEEGLPDEVAYLRAMGLTRDHVSMQGIGYKEMLGFFEGDYDLDEAVRLIKLNSRHYAKRQGTWFRRVPGAIRIMRTDYGGSDERILEKMLSEIRLRTGIQAKEVKNPYE